MYSANDSQRYWSTRSYENDELPRYAEHDPEYRRKISLIRECHKLLGTSRHDKKALGIAIIGPPGCGKSAFLNTIFASFSKSNWLEYAKSGVFETDEQFSVRLKRYTKKDYYQDNDNILMPTFVDMTGFDDCDSEHTKELLRIILLGKLKDNEQLANLKRQRLPQLKKQSSLGHEFVFQRINRIIAVCSYEPDSNLPRSLFAAINQVAKERDMTDSSSTCYFEIYDIPVYGAMTHADRYTTEKDKRSEEKEGAFMRCLGLEKHRFAKIVNYCPEVDPEMKYTDSINPSLDVPVLSFLKQVFTPDLSDSSEPPPVDTDDTGYCSQKCFFLTVFIIVVAIVFQWWYKNMKNGYYHYSHYNYHYR